MSITTVSMVLTTKQVAFDQNKGKKRFCREWLLRRRCREHPHVILCSRSQSHCGVSCSGGWAHSRTEAHRKAVCVSDPPHEMPPQKRDEQDERRCLRTPFLALSRLTAASSTSPAQAAQAHEHKYTQQQEIAHIGARSARPLPRTPQPPVSKDTHHLSGVGQTCGLT